MSDAEESLELKVPSLGWSPGFIIQRHSPGCHCRDCVADSPGLCVGKAESQKYWCQASRETWSAQGACQFPGRTFPAVKFLKRLTMTDSNGGWSQDRGLCPKIRWGKVLPSQGSAGGSRGQPIRGAYSNWQNKSHLEETHPGSLGDRPQGGGRSPRAEFELTED